VSLTTDPKHPGLGRGADDKPVEQNAAYLVLSEEERAKGFVRPVRTTYKHVGQSVCGKTRQGIEEQNQAQPYICVREPGHEGECSHLHKAVDIGEIERAGNRRLLGGCNDTTTMGTALAETYARDPNFYGATYCVGCRMHRPVGARGEFVWLDGSRVGT
jgi:hypothetical protein